MKDWYNSTDGFASLSVRDLLDARDQYHYHLMNKKNVVATAIGYYRIRKVDPWPSKEDPNPDTSQNKHIVRTLENSEVRNYSWPAVLVFVESWQSEQVLATTSPTDVVPKTLFLPDGRKVPICVIEAKRIMSIDETIDESKLTFPRNLIGGGFPIITYTQQVRRIASVGCLVTDGNLTYALTAGHVTGDGSQPVYSRLAGREVQIGHGSSKSLGRVPFSDVYPAWPARNTYLNMDIGLIEIDNLNQWKTDVFHIGTVGRMADLSQGTITLNLIGQPVTAFGSVSGEITGFIQALFYRFKSVGGFEYVSDLLIGSRDDTPLNIHVGDSGTVLLYDRQDDSSGTTELMPIALLWGQHVFYGEGKKNKSPYALATCLSTACNVLAVDLVRDWNIDQPYIWGKTGHYGIGNFAISFIEDKDFQALMEQNLTNISFNVNDIVPDWDAKDKATKAKYQELFADFCPLADVPDIIWKQAKSTGWGRKGDENPNHYMDADLPCTSYGGKSYLDHATDQSMVTAEELQNFYQHADWKKVGMSAPPSQGLVPLRVWQIFAYMVDALREEDITRFIFGAGVLAHYVGDCCQPLHSSYLSNGDPADDEMQDYTAKKDSPKASKHPHKKGDVYPKLFNPGNGVHSTYEDEMIDDNRDALITALQQKVTNPSQVDGPDKPILTGQDAGYAVVELMQKTHGSLKPGAIVAAFKKYKEENDLIELLWQDFGDPTIECIARGCRYQAAIWEAAWIVGKGKVSDYSRVKFDSKTFRQALKKLYEDPKELPSYHLDAIEGAGVLK